MSLSYLHLSIATFVGRAVMLCSLCYLSGWYLRLSACSSCRPISLSFLDLSFFPVCVEMRPANFAVVSTVFCCCVLLKNNGPALRCCVLPRTNAHSWPRAFRFGLGRFSRFCPLLMTSPAVTSWGSASGQSAKQADPPCMWSVLFVVWPKRPWHNMMRR